MILIPALLRSFGRVLIEGVKYYADQPRMLGKTFLRLVSFFIFQLFIIYFIIIVLCYSLYSFKERDFDKHVTYCRDEPAAQEFLQSNNEVRDYFEVNI